VGKAVVTGIQAFFKTIFPTVIVPVLSEQMSVTAERASTASVVGKKRNFVSECKGKRKEKRGRGKKGRTHSSDKSVSSSKLARSSGEGKGDDGNKRSRKDGDGSGDGVGSDGERHVHEGGRCNDDEGKEESNSEKDVG
jgi:hypothetical protein